MGAVLTSGIETGLRVGLESVVGTPVTPTIRYMPTTHGYSPMPGVYESFGAHGSSAVAAAQQVVTAVQEAGSFTMEVLLSQSLALLDWVLGSEVATQPTFAEAPISWTIEHDHGDAIYTVAGCYCNTAVFRASADPTSNALMISASYLGMSHTAGSTPTTIALPTLAGEYLLFTGGTFTVGGAATQISSFSFAVNNNIVPQWRTGTSPLAMVRGGAGLRVGGDMLIDWNSTTDDLITSYLAGTAGVLVMKFINNGSANKSVTFTFPSVRYSGAVPPVSIAKGPLMFPISFEARTATLGELAPMTVAVDTTA